MNTRQSADTQYKVSLLSRIAVLANLNDETKQLIAAKMRPLSIAQGKKLAPTSQQIVLLQQGLLARVIKNGAKGKPLLCGLFGPHMMSETIDGMTDAMGDDAFEPSMMALSDVAGFCLSQVDVELIQRADPQFLVARLQAAAQQQCKLEQYYHAALHTPLENRLAGFLSEMADLLTGQYWMPLQRIGRLSQTLMAQLLGVSREHVNRTFAFWEKLGLLAVDQDGIIIEDRKALALLAHTTQEKVKPGDIEREKIAEIDQLLDASLNDEAHRLALDYAARFPKNADFAHRAVLALARSGAVEQALRLWDDLDLKKLGKSEEIAALHPRLARDLAFMDHHPTSARDSALTDAANGYHEAYREYGGYYSGINAASSYALLDQLEKARSIAAPLYNQLSDTMAALDIDERDYWRLATMGECALILDNLPVARTHYQQAANAIDVTPGKIASSRAQLYRLNGINALNLPDLDVLLPQHAPLIYAGPLPPSGLEIPQDWYQELRATLTDMVAQHRIGWAYGSLFPGCDLEIAEILIAAGVELHLDLPRAPRDFSAVYTHQSSADRARFHTCLQAAKSVRWPRHNDMPELDLREATTLRLIGRGLRQAASLTSNAYGMFIGSAPLAFTKPQTSKRDAHTPALVPTIFKVPKKSQTSLSQTQPSKAPPSAAISFAAIVPDTSEIVLHETIPAVLNEAKKMLAQNQDRPVFLDAAPFPLDRVQASKSPAPFLGLTAHGLPQTLQTGLVTSLAFCEAYTALEQDTGALQFMGTVPCAENGKVVPLFRMG